MLGTPFFEIPVYRVSEEQYEEETRTLLCKHMRVEDPWAPDLSSRLKDWRDNLFLTHLSSPWKYNDVIGWVKLVVFNTQFRGEYYTYETRRYVRRAKNKRLTYYDKVLEYDVFYSQTPEMVREHLVESVLHLPKRLEFRGRYVHIDPFLLLAPHVNWHGLIHQR